MSLCARLRADGAGERAFPRAHPRAIRSRGLEDRARSSSLLSTDEGLEGGCRWRAFRSDRLRSRHPSITDHGGIAGAWLDRFAGRRERRQTADCRRTHGRNCVGRAWSNGSHCRTAFCRLLRAGAPAVQQIRRSEKAPAEPGHAEACPVCRKRIAVSGQVIHWARSAPT